MKRTFDDVMVDEGCVFRPAKRLSMLDNTPQQWKEERRHVIRVAKQKLADQGNPLVDLRRSVLLKNTAKMMKNEIRAKFGFSRKQHKTYKRVHVTSPSPIRLQARQLNVIRPEVSYLDSQRNGADCALNSVEIDSKCGEKSQNVCSCDEITLNSKCCCQDNSSDSRVTMVDASQNTCDKIDDCGEVAMDTTTTTEVMTCQSEQQAHERLTVISDATRQETDRYMTTAAAGAAHCYNGYTQALSGAAAADVNKGSWSGRIGSGCESAFTAVASSLPTDATRCQTKANERNYDPFTIAARHLCGKNIADVSDVTAATATSSAASLSRDSCDVEQVRASCDSFYSTPAAVALAYAQGVQYKQLCSYWSYMQSMQQHFGVYDGRVALTVVQMLKNNLHYHLQAHWHRLLQQQLASTSLNTNYSHINLPETPVEPMDSDDVEIDIMT